MTEFEQKLCSILLYLLQRVGTRTSERSKETSTATVRSGKSPKELSQCDISTPEIQLSSIHWCTKCVIDEKV